MHACISTIFIWPAIYSMSVSLNICNMITYHINDINFILIRNNAYWRECRGELRCCWRTWHWWPLHLFGGFCNDCVLLTFYWSARHNFSTSGLRTSDICHICKFVNNSFYGTENYELLKTCHWHPVKHSLISLLLFSVLHSNLPELMSEGRFRLKMDTTSKKRYFNLF